MNQRALQIAAIALVALAVVEAAVPDTYGAVRFVALLGIAVHSHYQSERAAIGFVGVAVAALFGVALATDRPLGDELFALYEALFAACALAAAFVLGRLAHAELAGTLRARLLTRRMIESEHELRRRLAETIHDGPVQELVSLEMMLASATTAGERGDFARTTELLTEARALAERNVEMLRDEIVDLGPYAFEQLTFSSAIEGCIGTWKRRYGIEVLLTIEPIELSPEVAGELFRITQEAVTNAGRHAEATNVAISLRRVGGRVELRVTDDGKGFGDADPLGAREPGHIGLAGIRERAELLRGELEIETSERGTKLVVTVPLER